MATFAEAPGDIDALTEQIESHHIVTEADRRFGGQFIRSRIADRTAQGVDVDGQPFAPYSAGYAKRKAKAEGRVDQVDLYGFLHHPHMMNLILTRPTEAGFEVGFWGEEAVRAEALNEGLGHQVERRFFAASEQDVAEVRDAIGTRIAARMQRATSLSNLGAALGE
jgi:hypothetical protein